MSLGIPQPRFMGPVEWMNSTGSLLSAYGLLPIMRDPNNWKTWFATALTLPALSGIYLPDPNRFDDWQPCAERFYAAIDNKTAVIYQ